MFNTTKLTLSIPKKILLEAKAYSRRTRQPLSRLVSRYFLILSKGQRQDTKKDISPKVLSLTGIAKSSRGEEGLLFESLKTKYKLR